MRPRVPLRTLLGDYPTTHALRQGALTSPVVPLDFADVPVPNKAFKRVVRDLEFDVAELALMTFLMARSRAVPLRLLPVVVFSRNPLPHLVWTASGAGWRQLMSRGCRIGVRAYATTTAVWVRCVDRRSVRRRVRHGGMDHARGRARGRRHGSANGPARPPRRRPDDDVARWREIDAAIVDPCRLDRGLPRSFQIRTRPTPRGSSGMARRHSTT